MYFCIFIFRTSLVYIFFFVCLWTVEKNLKFGVERGCTSSNNLTSWIQNVFNESNSFATTEIKCVLCSNDLCNNFNGATCTIGIRSRGYGCCLLAAVMAKLCLSKWRNWQNWSRLKNHTTTATNINTFTYVRFALLLLLLF